MTTNGTLLDDKFIQCIKQNNFLHVAYSFDGKKETQNLNRITVNGEGTFEIVESNAKKLLNNYFALYIV
jgi:sulfatase maturation enzyme AslB (radical SAM superfamily)